MCNGQRWGISLLGVAILALTCSTVPARGQMSEAGEHVPAEINTPVDYPGATGS